MKPSKLCDTSSGPDRANFVEATLMLCESFVESVWATTVEPRLSSSPALPQLGQRPILEPQRRKDLAPFEAKSLIHMGVKPLERCFKDRMNTSFSISNIQFVPPSVPPLWVWYPKKWEHDGLHDFACNLIWRDCREMFTALWPQQTLASERSSKTASPFVPQAARVCSASPTI